MSIPTLKALDASEDSDSDHDRKDQETSDTTTMAPLSTPSTNPAVHFMSHRIDNCLKEFATFSSSTVHSDRGIKLMQYTLWFLSKASHLLTSDPLSHKVRSESLLKLQRELSTTRFILRFYGMPQALQAVLQPDLWAGSCGSRPWNDVRIYNLAKVMAWSMLLYHPLEHISYIKSKVELENHVMKHPRTGVKTKVTMRVWPKGISGNAFSVWSCRAWMVFIVAEWRSCWLKNKELGERIHKDKQKETDDSLSQLQKLIKLNRLQMMRCALFSIPCLQWSMYRPIVSDNMVGCLTFAEAITCFYQSIYSLRES